MPRAIITGALGPVRTRTRINFDPARGQVVTTEWASAGDNLGGLANDYRNNRIGFDHQPAGLKSTLVSQASGAAAGYGDITIDTWQLLCNEVNIDVKNAPLVRNEMAGDTMLLARVKEAVKDYEENGSDEADLFADTGVEGKLFRLLVHGVTSFPRGQYVLRHTTNISNSYEFSIPADDNVEFVYSTAQLISEVTNTSYWAFPLPARLRNKILAIEQQEDSTDDITWGWRKLPSQENTAGGNRIDVSQEYWLGGHASLLYLPL